MSQKLISHSSDLKKLRDEGFEIVIKGGYLLVSHIPYVNSKKEIAYGTLVSKLDLAGERTSQPTDHVMYFIGDHPCKFDGSILKGIQHSSQTQTFNEGLTVNHSFSSKPLSGRYKNYYEKITTYANIISSQAESIDPLVTSKTFKVIKADESDSVFNYFDTNSSRAEINTISSKLYNLKIAIIGLGGTGSYVLDFVAKTPVKEIHLFDGDDFLQHNAFRAPGAPSLEKLEGKQKKVTYLCEVYSKMHKGITTHEDYLTPSNLDKILGMNFVFICIDKGEIKKVIIERLETNGISFSDVGMGVEIVDASLRGSIRITTCTKNKNDHIDSRISFNDKGNDDYSLNIQIAELNALNAALAVIKWKKLFGFYHDLGKEYNTTYNIDVNQLVNDEIIS